MFWPITGAWKHLPITALTCSTMIHHCRIVHPFNRTNKKKLHVFL